MAPHPRPRTRICLTGPECTGKTTLAQRLARELDAAWVPEFAREHAETCGHPLTADDVEPIARGQMANEDRAEASCHPERRARDLGGRGRATEAPSLDARDDILILDTDLISTVVYARHYYGACPAWIESEARARRADLYVLLDTDVEWMPDAARDAGGEEREDLFDAFRAALDEFETNWMIVSGTWEERWNAINAAQRKGAGSTPLLQPRT